MKNVVYNCDVMYNHDVKNDVKKYTAEFMGTAVLVFCGVGAAMVTGNVVAGSAGALRKSPGFLTYK